MNKKEIVYGLKVKSRKYEEMSDRERLRGSNNFELYSAKSEAYEMAAIFVEENLDEATERGDT